MEISRFASRVGASDDGARHFWESDGVLRKGPAMKYAFIERHKRVWPIRVQCRAATVSVSGTTSIWRLAGDIAQRRHLSDEALLVHISRRLCGESRSVWMAAHLASTAGAGHRVGKLRVQRLMQKARHSGPGKRKFRSQRPTAGTTSGCAQRAGFASSSCRAQPGVVGDLTYIATMRVGCFLLRDRSVQPQSGGWFDAADMQPVWSSMHCDGLVQRNPGKKAGLIFHSDRGSQYASEDSTGCSKCGSRVD